MKLYYLPGACSLASHILLRDADAEFEIVEVARGTGKTKDGADYTQVNPLGYVPAIETGDAGTLVENGAILPYLADRFDQWGAGSRYKVLEELSFLSSELHKAYTPFFKEADLSGDKREAAEAFLHSRLQRYENGYASSEFSAAKAYAFVITGWSDHIGVKLDAYPRIQAMHEAIAARSSVIEARRVEGLA